MIRCVVFDFDGTLVDSNHIKRDCFFAVADAIPDGQSIMEVILSAPDRGDRYATCEQFAKMAGLRSGSSKYLARQYSDLCKTLIAACPDMPGAEPTVEALYAQQCRLFINSATPEVELRPIVQARSFNRFLTGIFGRPATKVENLQRILTLLGVPTRELVVVGDGIDDHAAAKQIGCRFVPVFAFPEGVHCPEATLRDLSHLPTTIERLSRQCDEQTHELVKGKRDL